MAIGGRFRELVRKYGKVALGVHLSVSAASISGLFVAIKNNVDVESLFHKVGLSGLSKNEKADREGDAAEIGALEEQHRDELIVDVTAPPPRSVPDQRNRTAELAASSGGALALAVLCNKALLPVRVPITIALTPPVARFLARRRIIRPYV